MGGYYDELSRSGKSGANNAFSGGARFAHLDDIDRIRLRKKLQGGTALFVYVLVAVAVFSAVAARVSGRDEGFIITFLCGVGALAVYNVALRGIRASVANAIQCRCRVSDISVLGVAGPGGVGARFPATLHYSVGNGDIAFRTHVPRAFLACLSNNEGIVIVDARSPTRILSFE